MTAFWLPATQHCRLDALGIIEAHVMHYDHETGCCTHGQETQHAHDTCILVEFSSWLDTADDLRTPPPQISPLLALPLVALFAPGETPHSAIRIPHFHPPPHVREHPLNWIPARHFTERAAPVSRAPSPALA